MNSEQLNKIIKVFFVIFSILGTAVFVVKIVHESPVLLYNQVGHFPEDEKIFLIKSPSKFERRSFEIINSDNVTIFKSEEMIYLGYIWNYHYYQGNFSSVNVSGKYYISATIGMYKLKSGWFEIGTNIYKLMLQRAYEFFYYQRSNCKTYELVAGYPGHELSHMDDGMVIDGEWRDLYGGWFSAGDFNKHNQWGSHNFGVIFSCLSAFERMPEFYSAIDLYSLDGTLKPNGVPDILDEAMWGALYGIKCIYPNGSILGSLASKLRYVAPEFDTDQIIGTEDDRKPEESHPIASADESLWLSAGLAKFAKIIAQTGVLGGNSADPQSYFMKFKTTAIGIYQNHSYPYNTSQQAWWAPHAAPFLVASQAIYEITNNSAYEQNATWAAEAIARNILGLVHANDDLGHINRAFGLMLEWTIKNGTLDAINLAKQAIQAIFFNVWNHSVEDPENIFGLMKLSWNNQWVYFTENLGLNSHLLYSIYAMQLSARIINSTESQTLLKWAKKQLDWILGINPLGVCMIESIGHKNLPAYHHRFMFCRNNPRGAVPGAVPNGYFSKNGMPYLDMKEYPAGSAMIQNVDYKSNEPWLPHNVALLHALSSQIYF